MGVTICSDSFWAHNAESIQPFSHLRTLIEMCRITSTLHIQIDGLVEGDHFRDQHGHQMWYLSTIFCGVEYMVYGTPVTSEENLIARSDWKCYKTTALTGSCVWNSALLCNDVGGTHFCWNSYLYFISWTNCTCIIFIC